MPKYWETTHHHAYPWDVVAGAYWNRYPNPKSKHVFSEDFVECRVLDDGRLYTKRLLTKNNKLPSWGRHFFSAKRVPLVEEALCDPRARTFTTYTRNIGLRYFMGVTERVVFAPEGGESGGPSTAVHKEVWIDSDVFGFQSAIRKFGVDRFKRNCVRATEGFDWVLRGLALKRGLARDGPSAAAAQEISSGDSEKDCDVAREQQQQEQQQQQQSDVGREAPSRAFGGGPTPAGMSKRSTPANFFPREAS